MVIQAATERDRRIATRLGLLRFVPVALAAAVFIWVIARMVLPVRAVVIVADQNGDPVPAAVVRMNSRRGKERIEETNSAGRATIWVARGNFNYTNDLRVELPELGLLHFDQIYWREVRRGEDKRITLTVGDTVTGTLRSGKDGTVLAVSAVQATFTLADGSTRTSYATAVPHHLRNAMTGRISVTRPGGGRANSVAVRAWAPGHAPSTVTVDTSTAVRGHSMFHLGDMRLEPWGTVSGRTLAQRNGTTQSWSALAKLIVWSPSAELLDELAASDPRIEQIGVDEGEPYAVMRGDYSTTYRLTVPMPATRVVLLAMAHDRPPAMVEATPEALRKLVPGGELSELREAILPAPNPMTLPLQTTSGTALVGAQVEFHRYVADSTVTVAVGTQVYYTDMLGRVTLPILEDGVKYRVRVRKQGRNQAIEFDSVIDARTRLVIPD